MYALDLANVGGGIGGTTNHHHVVANNNTTHRGFYTLCAIWIGWIVVSIVVGYVTIFLGDTILTTVSGIEFDDAVA